MPSTLWWERFGRSPARPVAAGAFVYLKGDEARSLYVLRSGLIKISFVWRDGREFILRLAHPGDVFGETSFVTSNHEEHARALERSEIVEIPAAEVIAQFTRDLTSAPPLLNILALRLAEARQTVGSLVFATTTERLCRTLQRLASELGEPDGELIQIPHYVKQEDIARMTGARREVVSTLLNRLRERGLISYSRKGTLRIRGNKLERYLQGWVQGGGSRK